MYSETDKNPLRDLLLDLLQKDEQVQRTIIHLVSDSLLKDLIAQEKVQSEQAANPEPEKATPTEEAPHPPEPSAADQFYQQLASQRLFLHTVQEDQEIASLWLKPGESEAQALVRLLARASQWDSLTGLWDAFASRCKKQERALNTSENQLLQHSLDCYNLTIDSRQAELIAPACPIVFDHEQHIRATPQGETVTAVWLPGLTNAAGKIHKKPLVATA